MDSGKYGRLMQRLTSVSLILPYINLCSSQCTYRHHVGNASHKTDAVLSYLLICPPSWYCPHTNNSMHQFLKEILFQLIHTLTYTKCTMSQNGNSLLKKNPVCHFHDLLCIYSAAKQIVSQFIHCIISWFCISYCIIAFLSSLGGMKVTLCGTIRTDCHLLLWPLAVPYFL